MKSTRAIGLATAALLLLTATSLQARTAKATFAAGCFWCIEAELEKLPGVISVVSGYTGGTLKNPTYEQVSSGGTGHAEAVEVTFDPAKISYAALVKVFWENIDPFTLNRQFSDYGEQYRTAIFYHDEAQRRVAEESKAKVEKEQKRAVVTQIVAASVFYPAEDYHQDYSKKNKFRYGMYRMGSGRDELLEQIWGPDPAKARTKTP